MGELPPLALSFDDVLVLPGISQVLPGDVSLDTRLGAAIDLKIPVLSSAMDTVTESELAISLAREGGLGVIHRNCLINLEHVEKMAPLSSQRWLLTMNNQQEFIVSKRQAHSVRKLLSW